MDVINKTQLDSMAQDMSVASGLLDLLICSSNSPTAGELAALNIIQKLVDQVNEKLVDEFRSDEVIFPTQPEIRSSPAKLHAV